MPDERREARSVLSRILSRGEPEEFTLHVLNAAGEYVPHQSRGSAVSVSDGDMVVAIFGLGEIPGPQQPPTAAESGSELTARQLEILRLLAAGRSTDEIASQLSLSPTTVRNHIAKLLAALGVHTRLQAVVAARRAGLLDS